MKIAITGYTYTRKNLFEVFDSYPEKDNLYFILPNNWKAKGGKVVFKPFKKEGFKIYHSPAFFFHSHYPIIGGLFKGWMPFFVFRLFWLRIFKKVDILYTAGEPNLLATLYNAFWAKILGMKHIFLFWENIPYEKKDKGLKLFFKRSIIKANIALADGAICGMHKAEQILKSFNPRFPVRTFLHAGFNTNKFKPGLEPKLRNELGLKDKFIFLFVGALGYRKGLHFILDILSDLKEKYKNLYFILIGSGTYEKDLKKQVEDLKLDNVKFIPWLPNEELPYIFSSVDAFLYPSIPHKGWEEQFGYSIAEASLSGLPVISTNTGSIYEVLVDGRTGIMIPPNSKEDLQKAMERLINNSALRNQLGKEGREFIKKNFSNEIIAEKLFNLFRETYESK